ncbi:glycerol-3-phosphate dehydrogenase/oxidase [Galbibacter pacificus]|uniref:Glycerol-3-phosphate dehydrogenase/oxidase n=1 Tax=Galbibacter pacificus TaxID=2996052 RepID=A0ABT6FTT2_9FLAO|nr:glycerol-3-phosphate dehydrogenase/oxidase [Galbibacter pacificus]MDG3583198.1 glycerol-3-phosphate dehydrogenase/oxidase [Galbibacter pacificus]MDG3586679.1 glycerol-3-phosphate dehydrogenase/oxidase [Galbibacter pacificus]
MKAKSFSNLDRDKIVSTIQNTTFDLIVIGGGITGAGILLDAASRGLKTALVEKDDFASGTSSKSTKLIHGGLRYLKQFDFWLVREVGTERAVVHNLAPHLVIPEKMLLPLVEKGSYGKWLTSIGLKVYDILAQVEDDDQRKMLDKKEALALEPLLPKKILKGAGYYAEYRTDDARLTLENIKTALQYNSTAINYTKVDDFLYEDKLVKGVCVTDAINGKKYNIRSKYVINATGPWVDDIRLMNNSKKGDSLHLTKGIHLVFPYEKLPVKQSIYFDVPDGRMIFAIPRGKITYVGTTDTNYTEDKNEVFPDIADALYLIEAVNHMFPEINLTLNDIESSWAGLRPLIHEDGKSPSELSRKDEIFVSSTGLVSIAGGKLTGYRKMAERAVDKIAKRIEEDSKQKIKKCTTDSISLCGGPWKNYTEVTQYKKILEKQLASDGFTKSDINYLVSIYGKQCGEILEYYRTFSDNDPWLKMIKAEFIFTAKHELLQNPLDFFIRRTGRLYFNIESVKTYLPVILEEYQQLFNATDETINNYRIEINNLIKKHSIVSN